MFNVIIISHGSFAEAILETAQMIVGEKKGVKAFGLNLGDSVDLFREKVTSAIEESMKKNDVLVLTDIQSGSPYNVTVGAMMTCKIKHITGINLPIVVEVLSICDSMILEEAYDNFTEIGKNGVMDVNAYLETLK